VLFLCDLDIALAKISPAGMVDSQHDFSWWNVAKGEICIVCHTPHNARTDVVDGGRLWNHRVSQATYQLYSSSSLDSAVGSLTEFQNYAWAVMTAPVGLTGFR